MSLIKPEIWKRDMVYELISYFKSHEELWDVTNPNYINRIHKKKLHNELADKFNVSSGEISAKLHNLRCQFNGEIRKMNAKNESGEDNAYMSRWEYFPFLTFLLKGKDVDQISSNIENSKSSIKVRTVKPKRSFAPSNVDRIGTEVNDEFSFEIKEEPLTHVEDPQNDRITHNAVQPMHLNDSCQIFGDFVADTLRNLSEHKRKKLKIKIQRVILEVEEAEEEDDRIDCFQVIEKFEVNE